MERTTAYIAALLFGVLLVLASMVRAQGTVDKTLDPDTCQEEGTCWIPAGGKPQPIVSKVEKGTFNNGYTTGEGFLVPGTKKADSHLLWLAIIEEWYGAWCLYYQNERSYYKCLQGIVFESRGNPYGATDSSVWIERGLTSAHPDFAEKYDFEVCGDPEVAIWAASQENHERRGTLASGENWTWLQGHPRMEQERWLKATGSLNGSVILSMARKSNADDVTPDMDTTPWKRLIGALRKWDKSGIIYAHKSGISVTPWRMGFRLGRAKAQEIQYPMIQWRLTVGDEIVVPLKKKKVVKHIVVEGDTVESIIAQYCKKKCPTPEDVVRANAEIGHPEAMCYANGHFYDPTIMKPMPEPKRPFPGHNLFGKLCLKHKKEWRAKLGKSLMTVIRRGTPSFRELQEQGYFPSDEMYEWWEQNIGCCKVADSPIVVPLMDKINAKNPPAY